MVVERDEVGCVICVEGVSSSYESAAARIRLRTLEDVHLRAWRYVMLGETAVELWLWLK